MNFPWQEVLANCSRTSMCGCANPKYLPPIRPSSVSWWLTPSSARIFKLASASKVEYSWVFQNMVAAWIVGNSSGARQFVRSWWTWCTLSWNASGWRQSLRKHVFIENVLHCVYKAVSAQHNTAQQPNNSKFAIQSCLIVKVWLFLSC